jgi:hypothetical protein
MCSDDEMEEQAQAPLSTAEVDDNENYDEGEDDDDEDTGFSIPRTKNEILVHVERILHAQRTKLTFLCPSARHREYRRVATDH